MYRPVERIGMFGKGEFIDCKAKAKPSYLSWIIFTEACLTSASIPSSLSSPRQAWVVPP